VGEEMTLTKLQLHLIDISILFGVLAIIVGLLMAMLSTPNVDTNLFRRGMTITFCGFAILVLSFGMVWLMDDDTKTLPKGEVK